MQRWSLACLRHWMLASLLAAVPARAERALWLDRPDLHAHFWLSYGLSLTLTEILEGPDPAWGPALGTGPALAVATGVVAALGLAKELVVDPSPDGADLVADGLGLAANVIVQLAIEF